MCEKTHFLARHIVPLVLLAGLAGCGPNAPTHYGTDRPLAASTKVPARSVRVPPAPPIYAAGLTLQQGGWAQKIALPLALVEGQLTRDDPLWNYSDLLDDSKVTSAINSALRSNEETEVLKVGGERALSFLVRMRLLNTALSDLTNAGVLAPPIYSAYSGQEFRTKIRLREEGICAGLGAYPEISRAYRDWICMVGYLADPQEAR